MHWAVGAGVNSAMDSCAMDTCVLATYADTCAMARAIRFQGAHKVRPTGIRGLAPHDLF